MSEAPVCERWGRRFGSLGLEPIVAKSESRLNANPEGAIEEDLLIKSLKC